MRGWGRMGEWQGMTKEYRRDWLSTHILPHRSTGSSQQRPFITGSEGMTRCQVPGQRPVGRYVCAWLGLG